MPDLFQAHGAEQVLEKYNATARQNGNWTVGSGDVIGTTSLSIITRYTPYWLRTVDGSGKLGMVTKEGAVKYVNPASLPRSGWGYIRPVLHVKNNCPIISVGSGSWKIDYKWWE